MEQSLSTFKSKTFAILEAGKETFAATKDVRSFYQLLTETALRQQ